MKGFMRLINPLERYIILPSFFTMYFTPSHLSWKRRFPGISTTGIWPSEFGQFRNSVGIWTFVEILLSFRQRCRMSTIVQNPKELRQQFLLLEFLLSIFRRNFDNIDIYH